MQPTLPIGLPGLPRTRRDAAAAGAYDGIYDEPVDSEERLHRDVDAAWIVFTSALLDDPGQAIHRRAQRLIPG